MQPYQPPIEGRRSFDGLLLDFNERTTPFGNVIVEAIKKFANNNKFQIYPEYGDITKDIAEYVNIKPENIMITNGSDQGIDLIFRTFTKKDEEVIIPSPSFAMFYQCSRVIDNKIIMPKYGSNDMSFPLDDVLNSITEKTKLVVICNPNNPTGTLISVADIEKICKKAKDAIVYVDEAYAEFSGVTAVPLLDKYPNLIITRTFSKAFGLVALRIGYVIARPELIKEMLKVRGPYDINMVSLCAAKTALQNLDNLDNYVDEVMEKSKPMLEKFLDDVDIRYYESGSNFILIKPKDSKKIYEKLIQNGIQTRLRKDESINGAVRITIGTIKQTKQLINTLKTLL